MYDLLCRSIKDDPGLVIRNGGVIRDGYSAELDEIRSIAANSKAYLKELEEQEKEKTGIKMKIGYTKVFGYYFEISHANTKPIPDYYVRKQTLVNAERYITPALKEFEVKVLTSQERMLEWNTSFSASSAGTYRAISGKCSRPPGPLPASTACTAWPAPPMTTTIYGRA